MTAEVWITGIGLVTALGSGRDETWSAVRAGRRGLAPLRLFELEGRPAPVVAEVSSVGSLDGIPRRVLRGASRTDRLALLAAREAVVDAALRAPDLARAGVVLGSSSAGMLEGEDYYRLALAKGHDRAPRALLSGIEAPSATARVADALGARGPRGTFATACSSSAHALGHALDLVRSGECDLVLAGAADGLCRIAVAGFLALENVSPGGCRPFARDRDGMSLGEAGALLVVESATRARARGRRPYARLAGYGAACEAFHATATDPTGSGAEAALRAALRDAGVEPADVGYVNAHGTGTKDNDGAEAAAIARVFSHRPPVSSTKALHGHALAAAGALEAALTALALREGFLPGQGPTPVEPDFPIRVLETGTEERPRFAASLSLAFGGNDAALVLGAPP